MVTNLEKVNFDSCQLCACIFDFLIMNSLGLSLILKMGCICSKEVVYVNTNKYYIIERLGEG